MTFLIILLSLLLIGMIPVGISAGYNNGDAQVAIVFGFLRFPLYPAESRKKKPSSAKKQKKEEFQSHVQIKKKKRNLTEYFPLVQVVFDFLKDFHAKLKIKDLRFKAILGGGDPCNLGINYGRACAALGSIMPILESYFTIKNRNIEIACDYTVDTTYISGYICITLNVFQLLAIIAYHGVRILRKYYVIMNKAKDGAVS